ncbi:DUF3817 domain-containing protein [Motilibacter deserti]|uniref:DUF3817 domain-containing protein n=1 Tax=Motilibacter deserti TaxID=2714956 RepID=A0ABX0H053_9ACTN|nr:DUF3817 domain-containing protein [Motilibacter deserti]
MSPALKRYRVMAYIVGVMLLILVLVAMPIRYIWGHPEFSETFSPIHGACYIVYLIVAFDLGMKARWSKPRILAVLLAGAVPFLSFVVERRVTRDAEAAIRAGA